MATMTYEALCLRALERIGIKAPNQAASAADTLAAQTQFLSMFSEYRYLGLCPFDSAAIPEWAQEPLSMILGARCSPLFGMGERPDVEAGGRKRLATQLDTESDGIPIRTRYF